MKAASSLEKWQHPEENGDVPLRKVQMCPEWLQCSQESDNVHGKVGLSRGKCRHPAEGVDVPRKVALSLGSTTSLCRRCSCCAVPVLRWCFCPHVSHHPSVPTAVGAPSFEGDDQGDALVASGTPGTQRLGERGARHSWELPALPALTMGALLCCVPSLPGAGWHGAGTARPWHPLSRGWRSLCRCSPSVAALAS